MAFSAYWTLLMRTVKISIVCVALLIITPITSYSIYLSSGVNTATHLQENEAIYSQNGAVYLTLHKDGNIVLYTSGPTAVWSSATSGQPDVTTLAIQSDGAVCLYVIGNGNPVWCRDTSSPHIYDSGATAPYHLVVSNNGYAYLLNKNNVVYWHTDNYAGNNFPTFSGPTHDPTTLRPTVSPTNYPSKYPTHHPTGITDSPSKYPTETPTKYPTKHPTVTPTNDPTSDPTKHPTSNPTDDPTFDPTNFTFNPTASPSSSLSKYPTNNPTRHDNINGGEVDDETTAYNGSEVDDEDKLSNTSNNGLHIWVYVVAGCSVILCCLACILIGREMKRSNIKRKESHGDAFRMQANTQLDGFNDATGNIGNTQFDIWSNPVHKQIASVSQGNGITTMHMVDKISSDESDQLQRENYNQDTVPIIEMSDMNHTTRDGPNDDDIDNINNAPNEDNEVIDEIDNILTPKGAIDLVTAGGDNDGIDDDIDAINNNVENEEFINNIDNMITAEGGDTDDDDVIDDNLAHDMETPGGDDSVIVEDINMDEEDDFHETLQ